MIMSTKFLSDNGDRTIKGFGKDGIGDFDIHGELNLAASKSHFNVDFVKMYRSAHSIYYKATIEVTNTTSMSGHWYFTQNGLPEDEFLLNKVSGNVIQFSTIY